MSVRKTYMLKHFQRMMKHVMIKNKRVLTEFVSVSNNNPNIRGTFTTANPDIIKALEESGDFNRDYVLHRVEEVSEPVKETVQFRANPLEVKKFREDQEKNAFLAEDELAAKMAEVKKEPEAPEPETVKIEKDNVITDTVKETEVSPVVKDDNIIPLSEVANFQQAKNYLKRKYPELTTKQLLNKANVISVAADKGIKFEAIQA